MIELLPATLHRRERWKNGGGWTREILRSPAGDDWDWRVSVAEVGGDGPFSLFPGCEREIVLLAGQGMHLDFADGETHHLGPPHGRFRFAGERPLSVRLIEGPTVDFNLIWKRGAVDAQLLHRPIVGSMLFFGEPELVWVLYVLAGQVRTPAGGLERGDAARLAVPPGERLVIEGGGELLLARLQRSSRVQTTPSSTLTGNFTSGS
ncbi:MAG: HutD family protein [Xanthomonadaceae bacterium]|jgi:environmental stress-induced protein Ves|nr:HutD family protein [Xanthomonadaceae bacterium]